MSLVMPACLSTAESVSLVASDVSPTEPPRSSNESRNVPARRSGSNDLPDTARSGANGAALEPGGRGNGKAMTGTIASGPYLLNASLTSLPNGGRSSGSSFSVNNLAGAGDGPRAASPRKMNMSASREGPSALSPAPAARSSAERRGSSSLSHVQTIPEAVTPTQSPSMPPSSPSHTRHRRAQSASNPGSPLSPTAGPSDALRHDQSRAANRLSVASAQDSTSAQGRPSLNIPRPPSLRLQHRHTLQVPKIATGQRGSRDFSFSNTNASEDALGGSSAVATGSAHPRGSLSLVRRTTRSMHSDMFIEEIPQDPDAARWTETVRQKRASRRRRKEEEEDDRVMVGTKVDQHHQNWVTAYNMLTGIRFTVSRTNAKMDRELTASDFDARHKFSFDITGNELTPSAKYDFKFKDYAPWVFRHLRARFHIDPADYLVSLTSKYILSELGSPGKSGSFFYFSRDYKYIIKTIHHGEHKLLRKILHRYYDHVCNNPNTLISQFYGLHRVKIPYGRKIHFVVMNNLFPPHRDIHHTFDLKGSTIGREYREEDLERNPRATLKDLNWLRRNQHLELGPHKKELFLDQMRKDVALLQELGIMDYSLLVGLHDLDRGNEENLRDKTLQVFQPGGDGDREKGGPDLEPEAPGPSAFPLGPTASTAAAAAPGPGMLVRTPSKLESARKARELRAIVKREKPVPLDQSTLAMAGGHEDKKKFTFYSEDGGFRATHEDGRPGEAIYYLGIIDCLTHVSDLEASRLMLLALETDGYSTASASASSTSSRA